MQMILVTSENIDKVKDNPKATHWIICDRRLFVEAENVTVNCSESRYVESINIDCCDWNEDEEHEIKESMFSGCQRLSEVKFINYDDRKLVRICDKAFKNCQSLRHIWFEEDCHAANSMRLCEIGAEAFWGCKKLEVFPSVDASENIKVGYSAFRDCLALREVVIAGSRDKKIEIDIGEKAFYGCWGLTSVCFENAHVSIGKSAFHTCKAMNNFNVHTSIIRAIDDEAFHFCNKLEEFTASLLESDGLDGNEVKIGEKAFASCNNLTSVNFTITNSRTSERHTVSIGKSVFQAQLAGSKLQQFIIKIECDSSDVEFIEFGKSSFHSCKKLENINVEFGETQPQECYLKFDDFSLHGCELVEVCGSHMRTILNNSEQLYDMFQHDNYVFTKKIFDSQAGDKK